jgi:hypothetical protein
MSGLLRPKPTDQILALTRRLAEDYAALPLTDVCRIVRSCAAAIAKSGGTAQPWPPNRTPELLASVERAARRELGRACAELRHEAPAGRGPAERVSRGRAAAAPAGARRSGPRRGVA